MSFGRRSVISARAGAKTAEAFANIDISGKIYGQESCKEVAKACMVHKGLCTEEWWKGRWNDFFKDQPRYEQLRYQQNYQIACNYAFETDDTPVAHERLVFCFERDSMHRINFDKFGTMLKNHPPLGKILVTLRHPVCALFGAIQIRIDLAGAAPIVHVVGGHFGLGEDARMLWNDANRRGDDMFDIGDDVTDPERMMAIPNTGVFDQIATEYRELLEHRKRVLRALIDDEQMDDDANIEHAWYLARMQFSVETEAAIDRWLVDMLRTSGPNAWISVRGAALPPAVVEWVGRALRSNVVPTPPAPEQPGWCSVQYR